MCVPDEPTQVMSLDELMDLAAEPRSDAVTTPMPAPLNPATPRSTPAPAPQPAPAIAAPPPAPTSRPARAVATGPDLRQRVWDDTRRVYNAGLARSREWLKTGDNTLIAATAGVALLLLLVLVAI
jgi:hypothetical protein